MTYNNTMNSRNLDRSQQASRLILAFTLLGITVAAPVTTLGWYSVLPLLAIYPLITGLIGWDPGYEFLGVKNVSTSEGKLHTSSRVEMAVVGFGLIGSAFVLPESVHASFSVLALAGIFPALSAMIGEDLLQSVSTEVSHGAEVSYGPQPSMEQRSAETVAAIEEIRAAQEQKKTRKAA